MFPKEEELDDNFLVTGIKDKNTLNTRIVLSQENLILSVEKKESSMKKMINCIIYSLQKKFKNIKYL